MIVLTVTTFAEKFPFASRRTNVLAPLAEAPVVLALAMVPVAMLDAFRL